MPDTRTLTSEPFDLPDNLLAVEGFSQLKIFAFGQILATLS
jgi:hypothetical protein